MNKVKVFLIVILALFSSGISIYATSEFTDVYPGVQYGIDIAGLHDIGVVNGYSDGSYRPANSITRAEFTKIIIRGVYGNLTGSCNEASIGGNQPYPDVSSDNKFLEYICKAKTSGVVSGYSDGNFKPEENITYEQASKILVRSLLPYIEQDDYSYVLSKVESNPPTANFDDHLVTRGEMAYMFMNVRAYDFYYSSSLDFTYGTTDYNLSLIPQNVRFPAQNENVGACLDSTNSANLAVGTYKLNVAMYDENGIMDVDDYTVAELTLSDELILDKGLVAEGYPLDVITVGNYDLFTLRQPGTCNTDNLYIFVYDKTANAISQFTFKESGVTENSVIIGNDKELVASGSNLQVSYYSQQTGADVTTTYQINFANKTFTAN